MLESAESYQQTWPSAQLPAKVRTELNQWLTSEKELAEAKAYLTESTQNGQQKTESGQLIQSLCELIEEGNRSTLAKAMATSVRSIASDQKRSRRRSNQDEISSTIGGGSTTIKKPEQQMQSMILCKVPAKKTHQIGSRKSSDAGVKVRPAPAFLQGMQKEEEIVREGGDEQQLENGQPQIVVKSKFPWLIRVLPNISIVLCALLYLIGGAVILRLLDDKLSEKPFRWTVILTFETCTTIGWGDSKATNRWSQAFITLYTLFGVPVVFSAFANIGRLISPFYTVDWLFLTGVVRKKIHGHQHRLPVKRAINFLLLHQFLGAMLYAGLVKDLPLVTAIYFSITSMGTIGIGDYHPDTKNAAEAILALLYIGAGIILLSALLLSINYYYQAIFFIWLRDWLHALWERAGFKKNGVGPVGVDVKKF